MISPNTNQAFKTDDASSDACLKNMGSSNPKRVRKVMQHSLRNLRLEKKLTQKEISQLLKLTRSQYQRLESKATDRFTVGKIQMIAKALSVSAEEVVRKFSSYQDTSIIKGDSNSPAFVVDLCPGVEMASFCKKPSDYFVGTLSLKAKASLDNEKSPKATQIYYSVSKGEVLVTIDQKKQILLKKGEYLILENVMDYEMYNPHSLYSVEIMVTTTPSFTAR
jgi:transcriptional regulator with XRE-family HTH domain